MTNIIIIHGTMGKPEGNWFPWLKEKLEELGHDTIVPEFPTPEGQNLENWLDKLNEYDEYIDEDTIMIGHSIGPSLILNFLERGNKIKAAFLVAGFTGELDYEDHEKIGELNNTFTEKQFDWNKIKENCDRFYVFISDNDPYIPLEKGKELVDNLNVKPIIVEDAGHFMDSDGYEEFEQLLRLVKEEADSDKTVECEDMIKEIQDKNEEKYDIYGKK